MRDLLEAAEAGRVALEAGGRRWTYAELRAEAEARAAALAPGARTTVEAPGAEAVLDVHAVWRAGGAVVPLDPRLPPAERERRAAIARAGATANGLAALVFTSGSTGAPRAVRLPPRALLFSARASAARLGTTGDDAWLLALPLHHVGGLSVLVRAALSGARVVLPSEPGVEGIAAGIDAGASVVSLVPTQLARLLEARAAFPPTLRIALVGGAPCPPALFARARAAGLPVRRTYGLTEAASQVATEDAQGRVRPLDGVEVRIDAAPGEAGEILVRGPVVADGYEGDAAATAERFAGGWLRTRDAGLVEPDGALRVLGRLDDLVNTGGEKVAPAEVEAALLEHPAVAEACVAGVRDPQWGERIVAAVVLRVGGKAAPAELRAFARERLGPVKVPKEVRIVAELPRTASGKVARREVARAFEG